MDLRQRTLSTINNGMLAYLDKVGIVASGGAVKDDGWLVRKDESRI